jgi:2-phosphosulfolactate phosphatase
MEITLAATWAEASHMDLGGKDAAVIDVLRASSTIIAALESGAERIIPVATVEEGFAQVGGRDRGDIILGGERNAVRIEGYDLGNSPLEYTPESVGGRTVVLTTTNGTQAIAQARDAESIVIASLMNAAAVVSWLASRGNDVAIVCSGTEGRVSLDDLFCAGLIATRLLEPGTVTALDDSARMATEWFAGASTMGFGVHSCYHGRRLVDRGFGDDVDFCARVDVSEVVPVWDGASLVAAATIEH